MSITEEVTPSSKLYLLDGSSYIYRAYYGYRDLATSSGMPTNAVFGFTRMLLNLLQTNRPEYLAVVFDPPREDTFRREIYPAYKANRDGMPEDLSVQIPYIRKVLQALNIKSLEAPEFEADDVIATLARRYAAEEIQVTVVTGDKDLMQIVDDRIELLDTMKDIRSGPTEVIERFGVPAELVPDVLGLAGDTSDNIPGVPGIGEKTAVELVQKFGSLEGVLEWKNLVSGKKRKENLRTYADQAILSKTLATVRYDVELNITLSDLERQEPNLADLMPLLRELEFEALEVAFTKPQPGVVELYSDGSSMDAGFGGYGVVLRYGDHEKELSGYEEQSTSQRMELTGAIKGLEALHHPSTVTVFSDSQYLVNGMTQWIHGWAKSGRLEDAEALANQDLWKQLEALANKHQVSWEWIRGHAGHPFNERCDRLAKQAAEDGIQAAELAKQIKATLEVQEATETVVPKPQPPIPMREDSEFDSEEDGQLRLC